MAKSNAFFMQRLNDHIQYMKRVSNTLKGKDNFQGTACTHCKLGLWLYSEGKADLAVDTEGGVHLFEALVEKHEHFHIVSNEVLEKHAAGDGINSYRAMTEMHKLEGELVSLLLTADQRATSATNATIA